MSENSTLQIHTQLPPDAAQIKPAEVKPRRRRRKAAPSGAAKKSETPVRPARIHKAEKLPQRQEEPANRNECKAAAHMPRVRRKPTFSERLLRNSAIACAVLLGILALGNVREPWAQKASEGVRRALTMRINLDDSLGELTFVRNLMPESALVFLNVSGGASLSRPVDDPVAHRWSALQPWTLFDGAGQAVRCVGAGTVTAVSALSSGGFGVLVDHGEGLESVYANLSEVSVRQGDNVNRGDRLGMGGEGLYFELRQGGESVDPTERLAL